ncbi:MAG: TolC family protein, partial [Vicinamibacterales bacterium]
MPACHAAATRRSTRCVSHAAEAAAIVALLTALPVSLRAQRDTPPPRDLSLERAIAIALEASESVRISAADVDRAEAARRQAASERWPQVLANASYTRTLRTQFAALGRDDDNGAPDVPPGESCGPLTADPGLPADERLRRLEQAVRCLQSGSGFSSIASRLPFGRPNQWLFGASVSQSLYSGGRIGSQIGAADAERTHAELSQQSTRAEQ